MKELNEIPQEWKEASSFTEKYPPNDAELIGIVHTKYGVDFTFYKEKNGQLWYQSKRNIEKIG